MTFLFQMADQRSQLLKAFRHMNRFVLFLLILASSGCQSSGGLGWGCGLSRCGSWLRGGDCPQSSCSEAGCDAGSGWLGGARLHRSSWRATAFQDDCACTKAAARRQARRSLPSGCSRDFRAGYEQAFLDIAMGAPGIVPALPPAEYCGCEFRTVSGQQRVAQWFEGYSAGIQMAQQCRSEFLDIAVSHAYEPVPYSGEFMMEPNHY